MAGGRTPIEAVLAVFYQPAVSVPPIGAIVAVGATDCADGVYATLVSEKLFETRHMGPVEEIDMTVQGLRALAKAFAAEFGFTEGVQ